MFGAIVLVGSLQVGIGWGAEGPRPGFFPFYIGLLIIGSSAGAGGDDPDQVRVMDAGGVETIVPVAELLADPARHFSIFGRVDHA